MKKSADQIDKVRALLAENYAKGPQVKPIVPFEDRSRIAEQTIKERADSIDQAKAVVKIALGLLDDSVHQNRLLYADDEMEALTETMRSGQLTPLRVRPKPEGRFEILAGHRRKRAAACLGWQAVDCIVVERSEKEAALDVIVDNETHQGLSDFERAKGYKRLVELGISQAELGRQIGINRSLITRRLKFFELPAPIQAALELYPNCMSNRWIPGLLEVLQDREDLVEFVVQGIPKVNAQDGIGWTMQTLMNDLKRRASGKRSTTERPSKLSITNEQNQEILTIQRDAKRPGVYEIRVTEAHSFAPDELEQHLVKALKDAWRNAQPS